jgi:hypothetical protein
MDYLSNLFTKKHMPELLLSILFVIYLVIGVKMPEGVASMIDSTSGKIVVAVVALMLFAYTNPILGVLGLLVAYQLIKGASITTGMGALAAYYPTEQKKWSPYTATNQFPYTLEQEVVKNMTTQKFNTTYVKPTFSPVLENTYDASPLTTNILS